MAYRCTPENVEVSLRDYDDTIDLMPFIKMANILTNRVAAKDTGSLLGSDVLAQIETLLAGHFYRSRDHGVASESIEGASVVYTDQFGKGLESTRQGRNALLFDETGYLRRISCGVVMAKAAWLGKAPSDQINYVDRD